MRVNKFSTEYKYTNTDYKEYKGEEKSYISDATHKKNNLKLSENKTEY